MALASGVVLLTVMVATTAQEPMVLATAAAQVEVVEIMVIMEMDILQALLLPEQATKLNTMMVALAQDPMLLQQGMGISSATRTRMPTRMHHEEEELEQELIHLITVIIRLILMLL
jgi:hypothetical protein